MTVPRTTEFAEEPNRNPLGTSGYDLVLMR